MTVANTVVVTAAYLGTVESIRSLPSSYADVTYYTKIAYPFKARDERRRDAKYRLIRVGAGFGPGRLLRSGG